MQLTDMLYSLSPTYETIINDKKGFRSEEYSGSGIRNFSDVVDFEISELFNEDILDFVNKHYFPNKSLTSSSEVILYMSKLLDVEPDELYCIWLTTYDDCKNNYGDDIYEYEINDSYLLPISDLDREGILFVTSRYPGGKLIQDYDKEYNTKEE